MALPNVVIAGAPKSGTSSLFFWLKSHPEVCGSKTKETFYFFDRVHPRFNKNANFITHGLSRYAQFFDHFSNEKIIIEATAQYIHQKTAIEQLAKLKSKPTIIFIVREPAERLYSLFKFNKYRLGQIDKKVDFKTYLKGIKKQNEEAKGPMSDSFYINYINDWIKACGKERIKVYQFEELTKDKVGFMKKVAKDLGIDSSFYDSFDFFKRNETRSMKNKKLHRLGLKIQPLVPIWLQEKVFVPLYLKLNSNKSPERTEEERMLIENLKNDFAVSNRQLAKEFSSIDLSLWN